MPTHSGEAPEKPSDALNDHLALLGVLKDNPQERASLAARLAGNGWTIEMVDEHNRTCGPDDLAKDLTNPERCAVVAVAARELARVHDKDDAAKRRQAYALVRADHKSPLFVAQMMGVTGAQVDEWVRDEEAARGLNRVQVDILPAWLRDKT